MNEILILLSIIILVCQYLILALRIIGNNSPIKTKITFWLWLIPFGVLTLIIKYFCKEYKNIK